MGQKYIAFLLLLAGLLAAPARKAEAQGPDIRGVKPLMMLVVDTSASMEQKPGCTCPGTTTYCAECMPNCDDTVVANRKSRWAVALEALTGTWSDFQCTAYQRNDPTYFTYDLGERTPYHQPWKCAINPEVPCEYPGGQNYDGILDSYVQSIRFGLMTFDSEETWKKDKTKMKTELEFNETYSQGEEGLWSYGAQGGLDPNSDRDRGSGVRDRYVGKLMFPGCINSYRIDTGARNSNATSGGLITALSTEEMTTTNSQIQNALLATRPYGGTPVAAALDDLIYYFKELPDSMLQCRSRYALLITDGYPDDDYRNSAHCDCETTEECCYYATGSFCSDDQYKPDNFQCPYPRPEDVARALVCGYGSPDCKAGIIKRLFVVGFSLGGTSGTGECQPETDSAFCTRLLKDCGSLTASDNCGNSRTVTSCGTCVSPATCGGGGTANVCGAGGGIIVNTGDKPPSMNTGAWTNGQDAYASDDSYASKSFTVLGSAAHKWGGFDLGLPTGATVNGIEVKLETKVSLANFGTYSVSLSGDAGGTYTSPKTVLASALGLSDTVITLGGSGDTWGRSWTASELSNANFLINVSFNATLPGSVYIDLVTVKVYYAVSGGTGVINTGDKFPTANTGNWNMGQNAYANDNMYASMSGASVSHVWSNFGLTNMTGTINGIEVKVKKHAGDASGVYYLYADLSWDGGVTYTSSGYNTGFTNTSDDTYIFGGSAATWGRTGGWTPANFSDANFRVRLTGAVPANDYSKYLYVDYVAVNVYYTGGGSCTSETDSGFCTRLGKNCGSLTAMDNCGVSRTVASCGSCTTPDTCGGGGTANVCGSGGGGGIGTLLDLLAWNGSTDETADEDRKALYANNLTELLASLENIFKSVASGAVTRTVPAFASAGGIGIAQYRFSTGFQIEDEGSWSGILERTRYECNTGDTTGTEQELDSGGRADRFQNVLNAQTEREIWTAVSSHATPKVSLYSGDITSPCGETGGDCPKKLFTSANIAPELLELLPSEQTKRDEIVQWIQGTSPLRRNTDGTYRKLSDIYYSSPVTAGQLPYDIADQSYNKFRARTEVVKRPLTVYVGTNDGVLHAFYAENFTGTTDYHNSIGNVTEGHEMWGFIPPYLLNKLKTAETAHTSMLDGTAVVKDMFFSRQPAHLGTGLNYHTVLVMGMRGGGNAYVALDVTDPVDCAKDQPGTYCKFLWQFTDDEVGHENMGLTYGRPGLAQVLINWNGVLMERGIAILPGGQGDVSVSGSCPSMRDSLGGLFTSKAAMDSLEEIPHRPNVRCWKDADGNPSKGRSLYFVDLETGTQIKKIGPEFFPSPLVGSPSVFRGDVGTIATRAFVTDADGVIWRIDLSGADPQANKPDQGWTARPFHDMFWFRGSDQGQPAYEPPILSVDNQGRVVLIQGTGDTDQLEELDPVNTVVSLTELDEAGEMAKTNPDLEKIRAVVNWEKRLDVSELVTGPMDLFNNTLYFSTFVVNPANMDPCGFGLSRLYAVEYWKRDTVANNLGSEPTYPPAVVDMGTGSLFNITDPDDKRLENYLSMGVSIIKRPQCIVSSTEDFGDPYIPGRQSLTTTAAPAIYQLQVALSTTKEHLSTITTGGSSVGSMQLNLPPPASQTAVKSYGNACD